MEKLNRRKFIRGAAAAATAFGFQVVPSRVFGANDRLVLAGIGTGGKGASDIEGSFGAGFEIGVLCDVVNAEKYSNLDGRAKAIGGTRKKFPNARFYEDWREMLEAEKGKVDAVTVSTPDHVHAFASIAAMRAGMSVYCQKPLTHGIWEARAMTKVASQTGVVTQMGNQAHAGQHMRRMVELVRSGIIGDVTEVHCWTNRPIWPQGMAAFPAGEEAPKHINWDLWLGPAPQHDYNEKIMPFNWRGYWDFGTGALGDMACHTLNMPYDALRLADPTSVSAVTSGHNKETYPGWSIITFEFPGNDARGPVGLTWYDGGKKPDESLIQGKEMVSSGALIIGENGTLYSKGDYADDYELLGGLEEPKVEFEKSPGHFEEWVRAIKTGQPATSNFPDYAGPLTETILLGNLAVWDAADGESRKIEWDAKNLKVKNTDELDNIVKKEFRAGYSL